MRKSCVVLIALTAVPFALAQNPVPPPQQPAAIPAAAPVAPVTPPATTVPAKLMPKARVFIQPMDGFETFLAAAFVKKQVPLLVVDSESNADFVITGNSAVQHAGWAKTIFVSPNPHATASVSIKDVKTGIMVYAYNVDKANAARAQQSTAEACAKHIKEQIENNVKRENKS